MKSFLLSILLIVVSGISASGQSFKVEIVESIGEEEYARLMNLSLDGFDQSSEGFRMYSGDYELVQLIIPEYIEVNNLDSLYTINLHWHLGQIHAMNSEYEKAIAEMEQSLAGPSYWIYYVEGTIAFLKRDRDALETACKKLQADEWPMNVEILEMLVRHFDKSYVEAYNAAN